MFAVLDIDSDGSVTQKIKAEFPDSHLAINKHTFLVTCEGVTTQDLAKKIGLGSEEDTDRGIVFSLGVFWGNHSPNTWEWLSGQEAVLMDPHQTRTSTRPDEVTPSIPPMSAGESQWIRSSFTELNRRLDNEFSELNKRVTDIEKYVNQIRGGLAVLVVLLTVAMIMFKVFNISIGG